MKHKYVLWENENVAGGESEKYNKKRLLLLKTEKRKSLNADTGKKHPKRFENRKPELHHRVRHPSFFGLYIIDTVQIVVLKICNGKIHSYFFLGRVAYILKQFVGKCA